jgi:hypothetical protein
VISEVLTEVLVKDQFFMDVTSCLLVNGCRRLQLIISHEFPKTGTSVRAYLVIYISNILSKILVRWLYFYWLIPVCWKCIVSLTICVAVTPDSNTHLIESCSLSIIHILFIPDSKILHTKLAYMTYLNVYK